MSANATGLSGHEGNPPGGSLPTLPGFQVSREMERSRMGPVYLGRHILTNRPVTITLIDEAALGGPGHIGGFCHEAREAAKLEHPLIAPVVEAGDNEGDPYLAAEPLEGETLEHRLAQGPLAPQAAAAVVRDIARALDHAHAHHVVHLGLSPACIALAADGKPRVGGFGFAHLYRGGEGIQAKPRGESFPGHAGYAAPELLDGPVLSVGPAADVYGIGAVLYALLADRPPYVGESTAATVKQERSGTVPALSVLRPGVPAELETICRRCLSRRPSHRFASAAHVADALDKFLHGERVGGSESVVESVKGWAGRHVALASAGATAAVLAVLGGLLYLAKHQEAAQLHDEVLATRADADADRARSADIARVATEDADKARRRMENAEHKALTAVDDRDNAWKQAREAKDRIREIENERKAADELRAAAVRQSQDAARDRDAAVARRQEAARQVMRLQVAAGNKLLDAGDPSGALLWFLDALKLAQVEKLPEENHRLRVATTLTQCPRPAKMWRHEKGIQQILFRPDGRALLVAGRDGTVSLWDTAKGDRIGEPLDHKAPVRMAAFSPDGKKVATLIVNAMSGVADDVWVWDLAEGKAGAAIDHEEAVVSHLAFSPDGKRLLTVSRPPMSATYATRVWDAATGKPVGEHGMEGPFPTAAFTADSRYVFTPCADGCARAYDPATGQPVGPALAHGSPVRAAALSPNGKLGLTVGDDNTVKVWNAGSGKLVGRPLRHNADILNAEFSPDGTEVLTATGDGVVRVWQSGTGESVGLPMAHHEAVSEATFGPDGRHVLTTAPDGQVRVWEVATGKLAVPSLRHGAGGVRAHFSPDGMAVATLEGGVVRLWDLTGTEPLGRTLTDAATRGAVYSPDGKFHLRVAGNTARVHDSATGKAVGSPLEHKHPIASAAFGPDGKRVATVTQEDKEDADSEVRLWDAATGKPVGEPLEHVRPVVKVVFSPDGKRLLTLCGDGKARVWDVEGGKIVGKPMDNPGKLADGWFTPNGKRVLTLHNDDGDSQVRLWDYDGGDLLGGQKQEKSGVASLTFSPNGKLAAIATLDGRVKLWGLETRGTPTVLTHSGPVRSVVFSADGAKVVTGSADRTARVWDTESGKALLPPMPHDQGVEVAAFSEDGRLIVTAAGNRVRLWDAATGEAIGPALPHSLGGPTVNAVALTRDGKLTSSSGPAGDVGGRWERIVKADGRTIDELQQLARLLSGRTLDGIGTLTAAEVKDVADAWQELQKKHAAEFEPVKPRRQAWVSRGVGECERNKHWAGLLVHLESLLRDDPASGDLRARRATAYRELGRWDRAEAAYAEAAKGQPDRWELWAGAAEMAAAQRKWDTAAAHYTTALEKKKADDADLIAGRARAEAEQAHWDKAAADLARLTKTPRESADLWYQTALARLGAGDAEGYKQACSRLLQRYTRVDEGRTAAWVCGLAGGTGIDLKPLIQRAEKVAASGSADDLLRLATLLYRDGQFEQARQRVEEAIKARGSAIDARDGFVLALTLGRLNQAQPAREALDRAVKAAEAKDAPWTRRLEWQLLRKEAEEAVKGARS